MFCGKDLIARRLVWFFLCFCSFVVVCPVYAQEEKEAGGVTSYGSYEGQKDRFSLMQQAIEYSTKADAYNAYCSEPSSMSSGFLDKFDLESDVTIEQKKVLVILMENVVKDFKQWLEEERPKCNDVEFMLGRLEVMRKLKDVSYLLNGVDPATLPEDNIPELRSMLLPKRDDSLAPLPE
ncbi:MAG: hypothetical protein ACLFP8_05850 [Alphaproteobacteria bacterium]